MVGVCICVRGSIVFVVTKGYMAGYLSVFVRRLLFIKKTL